MAPDQLLLGAAENFCASYIITDLSPGMAGLCSAALCVAAGLLFEGNPWPCFPPALQHRSWGLIV